MEILRKAGNQGLVITTGGNDLLHQLPAGRTAIIRKIMWYNNTGALAQLQIGTLTNAAAFVQWLPTIAMVNTMDGEMSEWELPVVEFTNNTTAGAGGWTGDIYGLCSAALALVSIEVEEIGR